MVSTWLQGNLMTQPVTLTHLTQPDSRRSRVHVCLCCSHQAVLRKHSGLLLLCVDSQSYDLAGLK